MMAIKWVELENKEGHLATLDSLTILIKQDSNSYWSMKSRDLVGGWKRLGSRNCENAKKEAIGIFRNLLKRWLTELEE